MTSVAVIAPQFLPACGYFRSFVAADVCVLLDTAPFPRRGWVHRNQLPDRHNRPRWLTVPVHLGDRGAPIRDVGISPDAEGALRQGLASFPHLQEGAAAPMLQAVLEPGLLLVPYLGDLLRRACVTLAMPFAAVHASDLGLEGDATGGERILEILEGMGADTLVVEGDHGRRMEPGAFARRGIRVRMLAPYRGARWSVLHRLAAETPTGLAAEIRAQT